jgi:hypothetical protein
MALSRAKESNQRLVIDLGERVPAANGREVEGRGYW